MKKNWIIVLALIITSITFSQTKNYIDQPYLETNAKVDTLVVPDQIYLNIFIAEKDSKGKVGIEEQENNMAQILKSLDIDLEKQLSLGDMSSNFKKYFLKQKDILKSKSFTLIVYDAVTAGEVMLALEKNNISNVSIEKTAYSKIEELRLALKVKAIKKAKLNAESLTEPLGQKVGKAIYISDLGNNNNNYYRSNNIQIRGVSSYKEADFKPIDVEFEKIKVESNISVKFILE